MNSQDKIDTTNLAMNLAKSFRPRTILLSWVVYSCVVIIYSGLDILSIALGLVLFVAMYGIVAIQNDFSDIEVDKLNNRKDIPFSNGLLTESQLIKAMLVLSIITTVVGMLLGGFVLLWAGLYLILGYVYSGPINVKSRGVFAALLLGFCYGAVPWLIGASVTGQLGNVDLIAMAFASFVFSSGIIVLKDFKDRQGDSLAAKKTLLVSKGPGYTRYYYLLMTSAAYVLIAVYSYVVTGNTLYIVIGFLLVLINSWLLKTKLIFSKARTRSLRGEWARALFFADAILSACLIYK